MKFQKWKNHVIGLEIGRLTLNSPERLFKNLSEANASNSKAKLQVISLSLILSEDHLIHSAIQALNAFECESNYSPNLGNELLLRATATRQVEEAIKLLELKEGENEVGIITIGNEKEADGKMKEFFSNSKKDFSFKKSNFPKLNSQKIEKILTAFHLKTENKLSEKELENLIIEKMALNGVEN